MKNGIDHVKVLLRRVHNPVSPNLNCSFQFFLLWSPGKFLTPRSFFACGELPRSPTRSGCALMPSDPGYAPDCWSYFFTINSQSVPVSGGAGRGVYFSTRGTHVADFMTWDWEAPPSRSFSVEYWIRFVDVQMQHTTLNYMVLDAKRSPPYNAEYELVVYHGMGWIEVSMRWWCLMSYVSIKRCLLFIPGSPIHHGFLGLLKRQMWSCTGIRRPVWWVASLCCHLRCLDSQKFILP